MMDGGFFSPVTFEKETKRFWGWLFKFVEVSSVWKNRDLGIRVSLVRQDLVKVFVGIIFRLVGFFFVVKSFSGLCN